MEDSWSPEAQEYREFKLKQMSVPIRTRVVFALGTKVDYLRSVIAYQGAQMPMMSMLLAPKIKQDFSYVEVDPTDFEGVFSEREVMSMYDCPAERLLAMRRSIAAKKAVETRRARAAEMQSPSAPQLALVRDIK